jgi:hypothetical protein
MWFTPPVVPDNYTQPVRFEATVTGGPTAVAFEYNGLDRPMYDDGTHGDRVAGDGTWTIQFAAAEIVGKLTSAWVHRPFIGYCKPAGAGKFNVFAEVWTPAVGLAPVHVVDATTQQTDYVLNLVVPTADLLTLEYSAAAKRLYAIRGDDFDFLNVVHVGGPRGNRFHANVKNAEQGLGMSLFNNTATYGSAGRLRGINAFPFSSVFDTVSNGFNHEVGHQWINALQTTPYASGIPHWPRGNIAINVMGASIPGSNVGGSYSWTFTPNGSGGYAVAFNQAPNDNTSTYNSMELYLMGLAPASEVAGFFVLKNQGQDVVNGQVLQASEITPVAIGDITAVVGARVPDSTSSQKAFRVGTIVLSEQPLDQYAMSLYDWFARRVELTTPQPCAEGFSTYTCKPFSVATGGRATMTSKMLLSGPTMSLDRTSLQFAATSSGAAFALKTGDQTDRLLQSGSGPVTWNVQASAPWITVSPTSGSGAAVLTIGVAFQSSVAAPGTYNGTVTLTFTGASTTSATINVGLNTIQNGLSAAPFGSYDTPANNATGIAGSIGVTGWALDDLGVARVDICRDPVAPEIASPNSNCGGLSLVFIGTAVLVDGARSDVAGSFPTLPRSTQAGWGYLMLTNFLPNQGNGTYVITAILTDVEGKTTTLGTKTITCANNGSPKPFGAIDRPEQGETISGSAYANFGWVLANGSVKANPPDGGSVTVFIDGVSIGTPAGWSDRSDLTLFFPATSYSGVSKALAVIGINTTTLTNGVHVIFWIVTATNGEQDGIGSRFFSVANSSLMAGARSSQSAARSSLLAARGSDDEQHSGSLRLDAPPLLVPEGRTSRLSLVDEVNAAPLEGQPLMGRRGFDLAAPLQSYSVAGGWARMRAEELDRIELKVGSAGVDTSLTGYLRTGSELGPLPIGSRLDEASGTFTWGVGVGFVHDYDLVFVRWVNGRAVGRQEIRITLGPKQSNLVGPQVVIDTPSPDAAVEGSFVVAGWAADLDETVGTGVDTLHVWAYPAGTTCNGATCDPIFLGATAYGGERPDVAAIFGPQFTKSGYGLIVDSLSPGTYDLAVFAWSTVQGRFVPAKVVRVTVR